MLLSVVVLSVAFVEVGTGAGAGTDWGTAKDGAGTATGAADPGGTVVNGSTVGKEVVDAA